MPQRLKGQEVSLIIVRAGVLEDTLTDIQNFNCEDEFEIKSVGYLGEKTNRKDEIYNGSKFDFELHVHTQDVFKFKKAVKDRAQRKTPDIIFNITAVLNMPNGETPSVLIPDAKFGAIPMNVSSRGDYVKFKIQGEADDTSVQLG
jgi:hypothetical protein